MHYKITRSLISLSLSLFQIPSFRPGLAKRIACSVKGFGSFQDPSFGQARQTIKWSPKKFRSFLCPLSLSLSLPLSLSLSLSQTVCLSCNSLKRTTALPCKEHNGLLNKLLKTRSKARSFIILVPIFK